MSDLVANPTDPEAMAVIMGGQRGCFIVGPQMSKQRESAADRIWKEKLDLCGSVQEALVTLAVAVVLAGALVILGI